MQVWIVYSMGTARGVPLAAFSSRERAESFIRQQGEKCRCALVSLNPHIADAFAVAV